MQVTKENIQDLYKFTRQHYVEHYDVQTELVDHLANDIEEIWKENSTLTFEQARDISFKKFGIFGFMDVVEEKQKQLGKKYRSILCKYVIEWFKLPKIILTVTIFLFFYYFVQSFIGIYIVGVSLAVLAVLDLYLVTKLKKDFNKRTSKNNKKWMLEEIIFNVASFGGVMVASNLPQVFNHIENTPSNTAAIIIAIVLTITIIYSYVTLVVIPRKAEELLEAHYHEYKLV